MPRPALHHAPEQLQPQPADVRAAVEASTPAQPSPARPRPPQAAVAARVPPDAQPPWSKPSWLPPPPSRLGPGDRHCGLDSRQQRACGYVYAAVPLQTSPSVRRLTGDPVAADPAYRACIEGVTGAVTRYDDISLCRNEISPCNHHLSPLSGSHNTISLSECQCASLQRVQPFVPGELANFRHCFSAWPRVGPPEPTVICENQVPAARPVTSFMIRFQVLIAAIFNRELAVPPAQSHPRPNGHVRSIEGI